MSRFIDETPMGGVAYLFRHFSWMHAFGQGLTYWPVSLSSTPNTPSMCNDMDTMKILVIEQVQHIPIHSQEEEDWLDSWETCPRNPRNWPMWKKMLVVATIAFYTFVVYSGSAIYVVSIPGVMGGFQMTEQKAILGLSLYVLSAGLGPLLWGPLTEVSWIGRNPIYMTTAIIFMILSIPTAVVKTFSGFLALRFLQGLFGSPCLANGGASLHDVFNEYQLPFALAIWISSAFCGPAFGPAVASYLVMDNNNWRWSMYVVAILAVPALILLCVLPETYSPKIRHTLSLESPQAQQAQPGVLRIESASKSSIAKNLQHALIKPMQIMIQDPAILFVNLYTSFCYASFYSFMTSFPIAYTSIYNFNVGELGLTFICMIMGVAVAVLAYCAYVYFHLNPRLRKNELRKQEDRLRPALLAVWLPPIGMLIFGWTSRTADIHWSVGMIGVALYSAGIFVILQCLCVYVLQSYPDYAASLFAANGLSRSVLAAGAVHFGVPLYRSLGIGGGSSVLGGLSVLGIIGMWVLYVNGEDMRRRSRFAVSNS